MNEANEIELQLKSSGDKTLKVFDNLLKSITGLETEISKLSGKISNTSSSFKEINSSSEKTSKNIDRLSTSFSKLFSFSGMQRFANSLVSFMNTAKDRTEELNLFNVVFNNIKKME